MSLCLSISEAPAKTPKTLHLAEAGKCAISTSGFSSSSSTSVSTASASAKSSAAASGPVLHPQHDELQREEMLQEVCVGRVGSPAAWAEAFGHSARAVLLAGEQQRTRVAPGGPDWPPELSLVCVRKGTGIEMVLVAWKFTGKSGRCIELDSSNNIVATNPTCRSFDCQPGSAQEDSEIILPAVGAWPHKLRRSERPPLPPRVLRLKQMFEAAATVRDRSDGESLSLEPCYLCQQGGLDSLDMSEAAAGSSDKGEVSMCAFCLQSLHMCCAAHEAQQHEVSQLVARVDSNLDGADVTAVRDALHRHFQSSSDSSQVCCSLCAAVLQL